MKKMETPVADPDVKPSTPDPFPDEIPDNPDPVFRCKHCPATSFDPEDLCYPTRLA